ncbi:MAG: exosome complex protein Rrp4 [Methanobrevibacter sp.]|jgi:exosome complex component RRP4|nr:exosome complex protein Rrp4 [Candidatus Methanovirga basalitermitum]
MIHVEDKDLVVPGEILAGEGYYSGRGTFKDDEDILSSLTGFVSLKNKKISVVPLKSKYLPKRGDIVIGKITDIRFSIWEVDINSPYSGILPASEVFGREKKDLSKMFGLGDVLFLRVVDVDEVNKVRLGLKSRSMGKLREGILANITPTKVPRLIGKKGSMINMIKESTNCKIVVGQNGLVWIKGDKKMELITNNIIKTVKKESHTSGLTNRVKKKLHFLIYGEKLSINDLNENYTTKEDVLDDTSNISDEEYFENPKIENFKESIDDTSKNNGSEGKSFSEEAKFENG